MFCRQCGTPIGDGARFCPGCGQTVIRTSDEGSVPAGIDQVPADAMPTEPLPVVVPSAPAVLVSPAAAPVAPRRSRVALWVALAACGVIVLAGAAAFLYFSGALESFGIAPRSTTTSSTSGKKAAEKGKPGKPADKTESDGESDGDATGTLSEAQSYDLLMEHYDALWDLHAEIGLANPDGTYGGTGFAYEVFNPKIGSPDYDTRVELVAQCQALADKISQARSTLADAALDETYAEQRPGLLGLYDVLLTRVNAMLGAATIAVDSPDEASWRPTLSPASVDARKYFEGAYSGWEPVLQ